LNLPYELQKYVSVNKNVEVMLPDGTRLNGIVASFMPAIDSASQTQQVLIKVASSASIPENLIAKVRILKSQKSNAISLPKQAVLSDENPGKFLGNENDRFCDCRKSTGDKRNGNSTESRNCPSAIFSQ